MAQRELFESVLVERVAPQSPHIPALTSWAAQLSQMGFTPSYGLGDHGNMSCRTERGLLITARATVKAKLQPDDFIEVVGVEGTDPVRVRCRGTRLPSTDTLLHWRLYEARGDVHAILHGHDAHALAKADRLNLPVTRRSAALPSMEVIEELCVLLMSTDYVIMRDHGFLAVGRSLEDAGDRIRLLASRARSF